MKDIEEKSLAENAECAEMIFPRFPCFLREIFLIVNKQALQFFCRYHTAISFAKPFIPVAGNEIIYAIAYKRRDDNKPIKHGIQGIQLFCYAQCRR